MARSRRAGGSAAPKVTPRRLAILAACSLARPRTVLGSNSAGRAEFEPADRRSSGCREAGGSLLAVSPVSVLKAR
ncbi:hypothetical protein G7043_03275 [Lentzea sp. NEAU-D13]|uniref:Uncharacterized protein n=1 Tax=Lentzea alba TaxID=2714351 RepID=A0A7C9RLH1_9PSEU|nr:hypothetical protein [Lentzea alba]